MSLTDAQREQAREIYYRSRREQGLPDHITDPVTLRQAATLYRQHLAEKEAA